MDFRQIKTSEDDFGLDDLRSRVHEYSFLQEPHNVHRGDKASSNTAANPIDQLAEKSSYLEVAYLLLNGELPTESELKPGPITSPITPSSTRYQESYRWVFTTTRIDGNV